MTCLKYLPPLGGVAEAVGRGPLCVCVCVRGADWQSVPA